MIVCDKCGTFEAEFVGRHNEFNGLFAHLCDNCYAQLCQLVKGWVKSAPAKCTCDEAMENEYSATAEGVACWLEARANDMVSPAKGMRDIASRLRKGP